MTSSKKQREIYLDYAASTPVDPLVFSAMEPYFTENFGNAGSLHGFGQKAIAGVDASREIIARAVNADFREIIFTSSATEANNLALRGAVKAARKERLDIKNPKIMVSGIEHESILETARDLEQEGIEVVRLSVDRFGIIDLKKLKESLTENTVLVSAMYANNEIGTIQPIAEISKILKDFRGTKPGNSAMPLFHVDAVQAFQFLDCDVKDLGVDLMTLSAHKIYGPKGVGALYLRSMAKISAVITGGGQEFNVRSGTENVPAIVGFAKAAELRGRFIGKTNKQMNDLSGSLWNGIKKIYPSAQLNTPRFARGVSCLPNILNVYFPHHDAQDLLTRFDLDGLAASSGSACHSRAMDSSYVIQALGHSKERAKSSIRFSLGRPTMKREIAATLATMRKIFRS